MDSKSETIREGVRLLGERHNLRISPASFFRERVKHLTSKSREKLTVDKIEEALKTAAKQTWKSEKKKYGF